MSTTLTIALVVSWLLLFLGLFIYERVDKRLAVLSVQQQETKKLLQAIAEHIGAEVKVDDFTLSLKSLLREGKTYEAIAMYREATGSSVKLAKAYIDSLQD